MWWSFRYLLGFITLTSAHHARSPGVLFGLTVVHIFFTPCGLMWIDVWNRLMYEMLVQLTSSLPNDLRWVLLYPSWLVSLDCHQQSLHDPHGNGGNLCVPKLRRHRSWKRRSKQLPTWSICRTPVFQNRETEGMGNSWEIDLFSSWWSNRNIRFFEGGKGRWLGTWNVGHVDFFFSVQVMLSYLLERLKNAPRWSRWIPGVGLPEKWHLDQVHNPPLGASREVEKCR